MAISVFARLNPVGQWVPPSLQRMEGPLAEVKAETGVHVQSRPAVREYRTPNLPSSSQGLRQGCELLVSICGSVSCVQLLVQGGSACYSVCWRLVVFVKALTVWHAFVTCCRGFSVCCLWVLPLWWLHGALQDCHVCWLLAMASYCVRIWCRLCLWEREMCAMSYEMQALGQ